MIAIIIAGIIIIGFVIIKLRDAYLADEEEIKSPKLDADGNDRRFYKK